MPAQKTKQTRRIKPARGKPAKGPETARARLLEAAGEIFAEKGVDRATAKEIAQRAGSNAAAVNYYFGGVDSLYVAALEEARSRLVSFDKFSAAISGLSDPREKLRALFAFIVRTLTGPLSSSWMTRLIAREFVSPSPLFSRLNQRDKEQRLQLLKGIVGEIMGLPAHHPTVAYACVSVVAPCVLMVVADRGNFKRTFPELNLSVSKATALADLMAAYALGGLLALSKKAGENPKSRSRAPKK